MLSDKMWIFLFVHMALGCSTVFFDGGDIGSVIGRTMELDSQEHWIVKTHPQGESYEGVKLLCDVNLPFTNKYNYISVDGSQKIGPIEISGTAEGMNEKGLTVSAQTLSTSQYAKVSPPTESTRCFSDFVPWLLATFASVPEFLEYHRSNNVQIVGPKMQLPPVDYIHWGVADAFGNYIVIEVLDGTLTITNNTVGVFTNQPNFQWHLMNLNNGINIGRYAPDPIQEIVVDTEFGFVPSFQGHGFNLMGIPGDLSPPSRFIKLFYFKQLALAQNPPTTLNSSIALVTALMNTVFIPHGSVGGMKGDKNQLTESTQYSAIKIPSRKEFYFKGYSGSTWKRIRLDKIDFKSNREIIVNDGIADIVDVTDSF